MIIHVINKETLVADDFYFKCAVGKKGLSSSKKEGDYTTPKGLFSLNKLYYRKDRIGKINSNIKKRIITKNMGWCDDPTHKKYNEEIRNCSKRHSEKFFRKDSVYDYLITISHNYKKVPKKGSAIFIHLTKNYKPTAGCIALKKKDFEILLKLINKKTKIKIG